MAGIDHPLAQAELRSQLQFRLDGRHAEQGGVDRRLVDQVVGRLRRHRVGGGHAARRVVRLHHQHVETAPGQVTSRDQPVVPRTRDDDVGTAHARIVCHPCCLLHLLHPFNRFFDA